MPPITVEKNIDPILGPWQPGNSYTNPVYINYLRSQQNPYMSYEDYMKQMTPSAKQPASSRTGQAAAKGLGVYGAVQAARKIPGVLGSAADSIGELLNSGYETGKDIVGSVYDGSILDSAADVGQSVYDNAANLLSTGQLLPSAAETAALGSQLASATAPTLGAGAGLGGGAVGAGLGASEVGGGVMGGAAPAAPEVAGTGFGDIAAPLAAAHGIYGTLSNIGGANENRGRATTSGAEAGAGLGYMAGGPLGALVGLPVGALASYATQKLFPNIGGGKSKDDYAREASKQRYRKGGLLSSAENPDSLTNPHSAGKLNKPRFLNINGMSFDFGLSGRDKLLDAEGNEILNPMTGKALRPFEIINPDDPRMQSIQGVADAIDIALTGKKRGAGGSLAGYLANAMYLSGAGVGAAQQIMDQLGGRDAVYGAVASSKLSQADKDAAFASIDRVYGVVNPESSEEDRAAAKVLNEQASSGNIEIPRYTKEQAKAKKKEMKAQRKEAKQAAKAKRKEEKLMIKKAKKGEE